MNRSRLRVEARLSLPRDEGDMVDGNFRRRLAWAQRPKWGAVFLMSMLIVTILICGATSACSQDPTPTPGTSSAVESDHVPAPPDDCWGGALSADPLHCYVIDQAHKDGVIEVEGVYDDEGGSLYIYFNYLRSVEDWLYADLREVLVEKGNEFAKNRPEQVSYDLDIHRCGSPNTGYASYEECTIASTFVDNYIIPWASPYDRIWLRTGGAQSRLKTGGWASWTQVWPTGSATHDEASGETGSFDVSDVDVTNFPELDCVEQSRLILRIKSCSMSRRHPELGIAGWHGESTDYVQVKAPPGEEENVAAAREKLMELYGYDDGERLVIIPVDYSLEGMWRWAVVLNRFAVSSGNTIGITGAEVGLNSCPCEQAVFPLDDMTELVSGGASEVRETVHVWAIDPQRVADALPTLLPQLGIPVDAVGVIGRPYNVPVHPVVPEPSRDR